MLGIYHQLKAPNTYICVFTAIVAYASVFYIGFSSSVAVAQTDLSQTMSTFYEVKPRSLKQVSNELEVQIRADDDALYFQITVKKPDDYVYRAQENDNEFENEHVRIYLVPNENERSAFVFGINHQNAHFDGVVNESSELNLDWGGQWSYSISQAADSWTASGNIPWKLFSFESDEPTQNIKLLVSKHGNNNQAILSSKPTYLQYTGFFDSLETLTINTTQTSTIDIFPYYSVNHSLIERNATHNFGGELFWQPSKNASLDLTINPDFGQVESNELIVNFSAIEAFFNEQRPFFTRNQQLFDVAGPENLILLHTPRMGGRSFYEDIDSRDIDAALRYNYSIGKMSYSMLLAGENKSDNIGRDFLATRAKFNTSLGIWGLSANFVDTPSLERKSTVFGLDYFNSVFEDVELSAALVASSIKTQDVVNDFGAWLQGIYEVNDRHIHEFTLFSYGDELQLNDAGFVRRVDRKQFEYEYALLFPELESDVIEEISISAEIEAKTNFDNEKLPFQLGLATEFIIFNGAFFEFGIEWLSAGKDDNLTREFTSTNLDASWSVELIYESPEYLFGQIEGELLFGQENWSGRFYEAVFGIKTELLPGVFSEMQISNYRSDSWLNWEDGNIVDEYSFFENAIDIKLNYRASDKHEFRLRLELVAGEASAISGNIIVDDGSRLIGTIPDDFSFSEAAFQFRYKYTLTKQTAVYLSYTFGGEFENDRLEESRRGLFSKAINNKESHNVFLKARLMF